MHFSWLFLLFSLVLLPILTACDANPSGPAQSATATVGNRDQKGPGAAGLTATALSTPIPTVCPTYSAVAASTIGWKVYQDTHYPFHFAMPPGWRAGAFTSSGANSAYPYYSVLVLPPGSTAAFTEEAELGTPENMNLTIQLSEQLPSLSSYPSWRADTNKITIGKSKVTLYDRTSPDCGEVDRLTASLTFGQYNYSFYMMSDPQHAQNDLALFVGMIQSFVYTG